MKTTRIFIVLAVSAIFAFSLQGCGSIFGNSQKTKTQTVQPVWFTYTGSNTTANDIVKFFNKRLKEAANGEKFDDAVYNPAVGISTGSFNYEGIQYDLKRYSREPYVLLISYSAPHGCAGANTGQIKIYKESEECDPCMEITYYPESVDTFHRLNDVLYMLKSGFWEHTGWGSNINEVAPNEVNTTLVSTSY